MEKFAGAALAALLVIGLAGAVAGGPVQDISTGGGSGHLSLVEKDPVSREIVPDGARGVLSFSVRDGTDLPEQFVFRGHGVTAGTGFGLICYPDPGPETGFLVLGIGRSDELGDIGIAGDFDFDPVPLGEGSDRPGATIWLIPLDDASTDAPAGSNPAEYLFEYQLV